MLLRSAVSDPITCVEESASIRGAERKTCHRVLGRSREHPPRVDRGEVARFAFQNLFLSALG